MQLELEFKMTAKQFIDSTDDERTVNNTMRHAYRVLTEEEKNQMEEIKDIGLSFFQMVGELGHTRETQLAQDRIEEAVMWAVKHITK